MCEHCWLKGWGDYNHQTDQYQDQTNRMLMISSTFIDLLCHQCRHLLPSSIRDNRALLRWRAYATFRLLPTKGLHPLPRESRSASLDSSLAHLLVSDLLLN